MNEAGEHWNHLHENSRFRPVYPNDNVIRFLISRCNTLIARRNARFLDIGFGAGRHLKLAADLGCIPYGIDISQTGARHAKERLETAASPCNISVATMFNLPFPDSTFHIILSYGVFYYATAEGVKKSIDEMFRVLAPGGKAFVVLRTIRDRRYGQGLELEPNTFRLEIHDTNEFGTTQHFLFEDDVPIYFSQFAKLEYERTETTSGERKNCDSDWLITVEK